MTDQMSPEAEVERFPDESFRTLASRARAAGMTYRPMEWGRRDDGRARVGAEVDVPAGKGLRTVRLMTANFVKSFLSVEFEKYRFSKDFDAIVDVEVGLVECALTWSSSFSGRGTSIWEIPGTEIADDSPLANGVPWDDHAVPDGWAIRVADGEVTLELSKRSAVFEQFFGRFGSTSDVTLKISHSGGSAGPRVDDLVNGAAQDFLLDMDLKYHTGFTIARRQEGRSNSRLARTPSALSPTFPESHYARDAAAFYWYGVSAQQFPLLQYLAYYQVLEYFFSSFTKRATFSRLRSQLRDPAFDATDDQTLAVLIDSTRTANAGLKREVEQLEHTLFECVEPEALRNFIRSDQSLVDHFLGAAQRIKGTKTLRLESPDQDIRDQVAERVYKVRNRIVHTKSAAEDFGLELLLPISDETEFLGPEVELVRWLAQRALIHGARDR